VKNTCCQEKYGALLLQKQELQKHKQVTMCLKNSINNKNRSQQAQLT